MAGEAHDICLVLNIQKQRRRSVHGSRKADYVSASRNLLWLYSPVCVETGRKTRRMVFMRRSPFVSDVERGLEAIIKYVPSLLYFWIKHTLKFIRTYLVLIERSIENNDMDAS